MELVLPGNYVDMNEEEMMYLDGGLSLYKWVISLPINAAIAAYFGGGALTVLSKVISKAGKEAIKKALIKFVTVSVANFVVGTILGAITTLGGLSIGDVLANTWDRFDVQKNNGRLNYFW